MFWIVSLVVICWWMWNAGRWLRAYLVAKMTGLNELAELGKTQGASESRRKIRGTVVICGGSISGLLTARICSDHFEDVVIIEPEAWTATADGCAPLYDANGNPLPTPRLKRTRVFQYEGTHGYLPYLAIALEKLFPNFEKACRAESIPYFPSNASISINGVSVPPPEEYYPLTGLPRHPAASRDAFERLLRRLTREKCRDVRWVTGTVTGVVPSAKEGDGRKRLDEVVVRMEDGREERVKASLVVDCTGATAAGTKWLERAGYGGGSLKTTARISYDPKMRYRCFEFSIRDPASRARIRALGSGGKEDGEWYIWAFAPDASLERRVVGLNVVEANKILCICGGWDVDASQCPSTLAEFRDYLGSLRALNPIEPWVYEVFEIMIADAGYGELDPIPFQDFRARPPTFIQYHRVPDLPSNFVAIGDSVLIVNPLFGQGCSKACVGALTLNSLLLRAACTRSTGTLLSEKTEGEVLPLDFGKTFFQKQASKLEDIWNGTRIPDYGWDTTVPMEGETLATGAWIRAYFGMVTRTAWRDREVNHLMSLASKMIGPGSDLMHPRIVAKVLWNALTGPSQPPPRA